MLEKVARAMARQQLIRIFGNGWTDDYMNKQLALVWRDYLDHARAAIEAMRDPSEEMIKAANKGIVFGYGDDPPDAAWPHMIDAALNEKV